MIISKTPLRISFAGGGTDLSSFYEKGFGAVLNCAINKYIYVIIKERFDDLIILNWTKRESVNRPEDIEHELVREALKRTGIKKGVEIITLAEIPSEGSGLGSSSSLIVGLLNAFYEFKGIQASHERLAVEACKIEIDILGKPIGKQDHYAAAFGGLNEIIFNKNGSVKVNRINISDENLRILDACLLLFFTGMTRKAEAILKKQKEKTDFIFETLMKMRSQTSYLKDCFENRGIDSLGEIMNCGWAMKKSLLSEISNKDIDEMYGKALKAGASGGKICGAGGGGFLLLCVSIENQNAVKDALKEYREFPFMLERYGSRIIFNHRSDYWSK